MPIDKMLIESLKTDLAKMKAEVAKCRDDKQRVLDEFYKHHRPGYRGDVPGLPNCTPLEKEVTRLQNDLSLAELGKLEMPKVPPVVSGLDGHISVSGGIPTPETATKPPARRLGPPIGRPPDYPTIRARRPSDPTQPSEEDKERIRELEKEAKEGLPDVKDSWEKLERDKNWPEEGDLD